MFLESERMELVASEVRDVFRKYNLNNGEIMFLLTHLKDFEMSHAIISIMTKIKEK